jgi:hypothetical protein
MWKPTVAGKLFVLHEDSVVGWMMKESSINYWQGKVVSHPQSIHTISEVSLDSYSLCTQGIKWLGHEANHLSLSGARVKNVWSRMRRTSTPLYSLSVWYLMKHEDTCTLYRVFSY